MLLRCIQNDQILKILKEFRDEVCGGHFTPTTMTYNIIRASYYWDTIF